MDSNWHAMSSKKIKVLRPKGHFPKPSLNAKAQRKITLVVDKCIIPKFSSKQKLNLQTLLKFHLYLRNVTAPL